MALGQLRVPISIVNQTLTLDQVAEFWRTRRVKEEAGGFASIPAVFSPASPIHPGNPGSEIRLERDRPISQTAACRIPVAVGL